MGNNTAAIREAGFSIPPPDTPPRPDTIDWDSESSCNGQDAIEVEGDVEGPAEVVVKGEADTESEADAETQDGAESGLTTDAFTTAPFTTFREYHDLVKSLAEISQKKVVVNIHLKYVKCVKCNDDEKSKKSKRIGAFCIPN